MGNFDLLAKKLLVVMTSGYYFVFILEKTVWTLHLIRNMGLHRGLGLRMVWLDLTNKVSKVRSGITAFSLATEGNRDREG